MNNIRVDLGERSYEIKIGSNLLKQAGHFLKELGLAGRVVILSNPIVERLYCEDIHKSLAEAGFECYRVIMPEGEQYKTYDWACSILTEILKHRLDRKSCIIALGGGVVGDMAGFVSSIYMRGINFVQVPTTLLAQVDSSVGGKTGVNHQFGKNMIGTFYQPRLVLADTLVLKTLPPREFLCGMAEVIKYGIISDSSLFDYLETEKNRILAFDEQALAHIIKRSCEIKADVVSKDERESGLREILNFGHTAGHALETETGYLKYLHGEAVAIGMCIESRISCSMGLLNTDQLRRIEDLIKSYNLPVSLPEGISLKNLVKHMQLDKKTVGGRVKFILPESIGSVRIETGVSEEIIMKSFR
ncbi:MAG: 3-dehydroquinate synthase [Dissulfurispiraceae bacterium]|jgi:3-dehydroquinate synthase|nr:3-dehydroquinate synthase [Dissulfurispiraceae bacterium]